MTNRDPLLIRGLRYRSGLMNRPRTVSRISAYVYGNVLVLAAIVASTPSGVRTGEALIYITGTALTTFLAHVLAHTFSASAVGGKAARTEMGHQLRDAVPILTSGLMPAVMVGLSALVSFDDRLGLAAAAALILVRLASTGLVVQRLSGRSASAGALWGGIALAVVASIIVAVKLLIGH